MQSYTFPRRYKSCDISDLLGKTLAAADRTDQHGEDQIDFVTNDGHRYQMYHRQGCCESVTIDDIAGDLADLVGSPITLAEAVSNSDETPEGMEDRGSESFTWTFYKLATAKGYVTIRWYGESSGYYSEEVSFEKVLHANE